MEIDVRKLGKNPFKEVRNNYTENETGLIYIDAWVDDDDDSGGISVATVDKDGNVNYKYPQRNFESYLVIESILEAIGIQMDKKQELVDKCLEEIKKDIASGDLTAIDELLKFTPAEYLEGYLSDIL